MPLPNEHSARIRDPNLFMKGDENWGSKDIDTGIRIILGRLKSSGKWETQCYRFKADKFTVEQAKKWLKDHDIKYILFEPAKDSKSSNDLGNTVRTNGENWRAIPFDRHGNTPKADEDTEWDANEEVGKATAEKLAKMCLFEDVKNKENKTAYKGPHHTADGNKVVWRAVANCMAILRGGRGGFKGLPQDELKKGYNHLVKHYKQFDKEPPEFSSEDKMKECENTERRSMIIADAEMRLTDDEKPKLVGYAAKYGVTANLGFFIEKIRAGAFDEVLKSSDARALKNHDPNLILGRESSSTLRLQSNSVGLHFEIDIPDTTTGHDTAEEVRRGDLNGCSFAFIVEEDEWKHKEGQQSERIIIKIGKLFDVGPVTYPAYEDTTVALRSLEQYRQTENGEQKTENGKIDKERQREIEKGYLKAGRIINRIRSADV